MIGQVPLPKWSRTGRPRRSPSDPITARALDDERVSIELIDTGSGISPAEQARIFDRFYRGGTRNPNGFGLGLAIVGQAVSALNGTIEVHSKEGAGTRAAVTLPLARRPG